MTCTLIFADLFIENLFMGKFSLENAIFLQWACKYRLGNVFLIHWAAPSPSLDQLSDIAKWNFVTPCFKIYEQQTGAMISDLFTMHIFVILYFLCSEWNILWNPFLQCRISKYLLILQKHNNVCKQYRDVSRTMSKTSILDIWHGSEIASVISLKVAINQILKILNSFSFGSI